jgi:hypothetical protein
MAQQRGQKDLLARLADAGEDALTRLASTPGTEKVFGAMTTMRDQVDALANKVRGIDALERRIEDLEKQVAKLSKPSTSSSRSRSSSGTAKSSSSAARSTTKKSSASSTKP